MSTPVEPYDNRAVYMELHENYKSPVCDMPIEDIIEYIELQRLTYGVFTKDLLGGDMLTKEQFIASVTLGIDENEARLKLGRRIDW